MTETMLEAPCHPVLHSSFESGSTRTASTALNKACHATLTGCQITMLKIYTLIIYHTNAKVLQTKEMQADITLAKALHTHSLSLSQKKIQAS